jgi:DNA-binding NtrC family response regulator
MGQASFKPTALVVEDEQLQRELVAALLEESEIGVIQCDNAEAALRVLEMMGASLSLLFTDVKLPGRIDGVELAHFAHKQYPDMHVIVTSGLPLAVNLPEGTTFIAKPWNPTELLLDVKHSQH